MLTPLFGAVRQTAYLVPDVDQAIEEWGRQLEIGPFALCREITPLAGSKYRGEPAPEVVMNVAFAYLGELQLELIEQVNDTPSMYREAIEKRGYGHHHYGFCIEDFDGTTARALAGDFDAVVEAGVPGFARMSYIESKTIPGLVCEVIEWNDFTRPYFDGIHRFLGDADEKQRVRALDLAALVAGDDGAA
ncbi:MAG: VOC family protein [Myxococcota bacterium]